MRKIIGLLSVVLLLIIVSVANAEIIIDRQVQAELRVILEKTQPVYHVDDEKGMMIFAVIDKWVGERMNLETAEKHISKDKQSIAYSVRKITGDQPVTKLQEKSAFNSFYLQSPYKRRYIKDVTEPVKIRLANNVVEKIGREFIREHGFCQETALDIMAKAEVIARIRQKVFEKETLGEKLVMVQNAIFNRKIDGLQVFNSRQIVGVHPKSKEILSYKTLNWTPLKEDSAKKMEYESLEVILDRIKKAYEKSSDTFDVSKISAGMYQQSGLIFPVVRIKANPRKEEGSIEPGRKNLIVGLVKDLDLELGSRQKVMQPDSVKESRN